MYEFVLCQLQERLLRIHHGSFQEDAAYLLSWITPAIANLFLNHSIEMQPKHIVYGVGVPLDCHRNALEYATLHAGASAWFGFSLCRGVWWLHSWCLEEEDRTLIDSGPPSAPQLYVGIPWGRELYSLIPKRPGSTITMQDLPPVLQRSRFVAEGQLQDAHSVTRRLESLEKTMCEGNI